MERKKQNILNRIDGRESGQIAAWSGGNSAAGFIDARAADVPHPFNNVMVTVVELRLKHLQVAHLQARWSKRNLQKEERSLNKMRLVDHTGCFGGRK